MPLPNPTMIPFMSVQSAGIGYYFGVFYQYGKRKVMAMSNEKFNNTSFRSLLASMSSEMDALVPHMDRGMKQTAQPMVDSIMQATALMLNQFAKSIPEAVQTTFTGNPSEGLATPDDTGIPEFLRAYGATGGGDQNQIPNWMQLLMANQHPAVSSNDFEAKFKEALLTNAAQPIEKVNVEHKKTHKQNVLDIINRASAEHPRDYSARIKYVTSRVGNDFRTFYPQIHSKWTAETHHPRHKKLPSQTVINQSNTPKGKLYTALQKAKKEYDYQLKLYQSRAKSYQGVITSRSASTTRKNKARASLAADYSRLQSYVARYNKLKDQYNRA